MTQYGRHWGIDVTVEFRNDTYCKATYNLEPIRTTWQDISYRIPGICSNRAACTRHSQANCVCRCVGWSFDYSYQANVSNQMSTYEQKVGHRYNLFTPAHSEINRWPFALRRCDYYLYWGECLSGVVSILVEHRTLLDEWLAVGVESAFLGEKQTTIIYASESSDVGVSGE